MLGHPILFPFAHLCFLFSTKTMSFLLGVPFGLQVLPMFFRFQK